MKTSLSMLRIKCPLRFVGELGYDASKVIKVPQQWP